MPDHLPPHTPLKDAGFLPTRQVRSLANLGVHTLDDLLRHYPRRYEDRRRFDGFPDSEPTKPLCMFGRVRSARMLYWGRRRVFEAVLEQANSTGMAPSLVCRWFHVFHARKSVVEGARLVVYGLPKNKGKRMILEHPEFEIVEEAAEAPGEFLHFGRIVPVHPAGEGITPRALRKAVQQALDQVEQTALAWSMPQDAAGIPRFDALRAIHFPESMEEYGRARDALALEEFVEMQVVIASRKRRYLQTPAVPLDCGGAAFKRVLASLPFKPTSAQHRAITEIRADLARTTPMNRLLQGDVGSGKTLVALAAMLDTVESNRHAVLIAPTQMLAEQHYRTIRSLTPKDAAPVALLTAARSVGAKLPIFDEATKGGRILVGTHALLHGRADLSHTGLVVIDEQHKFGVRQRAALIHKGSNPHVLVMSATPIPRTLAMTLYGDLAVSTLDEMPPGRGSISTGVRHPKSLERIIAFLRQKLERGRQAYIVYPAIEESDKLDAKAATVEFEAWKNRLAPHRCAIVHGQIDPAEREETMQAFRDGAIHALVTTSVIEVGIDVPNATILLVENAERFGLAQLHQLRGRIGRGTAKSHCILMAGDNASPEAIQRLETLERTRDGFRIAEEDFRMRGPGDLVGTAQSGLPPLRLASLLDPAERIAIARNTAEGILMTDPELLAPNNERLRRLVVDHVERNFSEIS